MLKTSQTSDSSDTLRIALQNSLVAQATAQRNVAQLIPVCQEQQKKLIEQEAQHATMQALLAAQQVQLAALQSQLAAQTAQLEELETFREAAEQQFGTDLPIVLTQALLEIRGYPSCLAPICGFNDVDLMRFVMDKDVPPQLRWLIVRMDPETDEEFEERAGAALFDHVADAASEIHHRDNNATILGMPVSHLIVVLEMATATDDDPYVVRTQFSTAPLTPEWGRWFNEWVDEDAANQDEFLPESPTQTSSAGKAASQAQPSSAGKQVKPCKHWAATGSCPRGDNCWFTH